MKKILCFMLSMLFTTVYAHDPVQLERFKITQQCQGCNFNELNLSPQILGSDDYRNAVLSGTYFYGSTIEDMNFQGLQAQELIGLGLMLHNNELSYADFSYADLPNLKITMFNRGEYINFYGAGIDQANLSYTIFESPQFTAASMSNAVLYHVNWPNASLARARLRGANLTYAMLKGADLSDANLTSALLSHADLSDANLLGALITQEQLDTTASVCNAILPDGSLGSCT